MTAAVITTSGLVKKFGRLRAVDGLDLEVPEKSIYAFLGPNGAGKTTTIKMLLNLLSPTGGEARVLGTDTRRLGPDELGQIGYVSENQELPEWMTLAQLIGYCRPFYPTWDEQLCRDLRQQFQLPDNRKLKHLSRGMKIKAALLVSLSYRPRLLVLDEPFGGLDPLVRDELIVGILELSDQQSWSVFISSHDVAEVEKLADWVGFLRDGRLLLAESAASLQRSFRSVEVAHGGPPATAWPRHWLSLRSRAGVTRFVDSQYDGDRLDREIRETFSEIQQVDVRPTNLREIFLALGDRSAGGGER